MNFGQKLMMTAVAILAPVVMNADPITSNPALSVNGLSFNNFTCSLTLKGAGAQPSSCDQINVNTITKPGYGIEFSSGFTTGFINSFDDAVLHFDVSSTDGISAIGLGFNGTFLSLGVSSVTEQSRSFTANSWLVLLRLPVALSVARKPKISSSTASTTICTSLRTLMSTATS